MHGATQIRYEKIVTEKKYGAKKNRYEKVVTGQMHGATQRYEKIVTRKIHRELVTRLLSALFELNLVWGVSISMEKSAVFPEHPSLNSYCFVFPVYGFLCDKGCSMFDSIAEDLICREIPGWSEYLVDFGGLLVNFTSDGGCRTVPEACSFPSRVSDTGASFRFHTRRSSNLNDNLPVNSILEIVRSTLSYGGFRLIFEGLMLPVYGLKFTWKLTLASWRNGQHTLPDSFVYLLIPGLINLLLDITIGRLLVCSEIRSLMSFSFDDIIVPGFFSNHGPLYFVSTKKFFSKMGLTCHIAKIHSEASVEQNAWELKQYIEELHWGSGKHVMLLGHSKGGVDAAAALSKYCHDLKDKVAGLAFLQSPYGGTPVASDILRDGQIADKETRRIMEFLICKLIKGDIRALEDLTYEKRKEFIKNHKLPDDIPLISFHSEASIALNVIATMSHIAHAELPWLPLHGFGDDDSESFIKAGCKVPVIVPVSAALALCALHLQLRYGEKSDGLVTCRDAEVPGSVVVKPDMKLDHAWMVYSSWRKDPNEPEASEMCEALLTMLVELARRKWTKENCGSLPFEVSKEKEVEDQIDCGNGSLRLKLREVVAWEWEVEELKYGFVTMLSRIMIINKDARKLENAENTQKECRKYTERVNA
ncbi:putative sugar transport protein 14-like [Capsicum annuum]|nr:putative sugar transport protein 14-like [Capsicum annuum]